jgi:hypothetical protein
MVGDHLEKVASEFLGPSKISRIIFLKPISPNLGRSGR